MKDVVAGVDIGGTNTMYGLVDQDGNIMAEGRLSTPEYPEIKDFVSVLTATIQQLVSSSDNVKLRGIGIGAPNANYHKGTIELAPNLAWKGIVPLTSLVKKKVNLPVVMTNDANAAALGEMIFGDNPS